MRTTITLDERLFSQLKKRAAESGTSASRLVEQAIRLFLRMPPAKKRAGKFELITFGADGRFSKHNIDKASSLLEADDVERFAGRR